MMTRRTPPKGMLPEDKRLWLQEHKNRNLHSVKFPDHLEEDYQAWKEWANMPNDNAAIRHLVQTHPEIQNND